MEFRLKAKKKPGLGSQVEVLSWRESGLDCLMCADFAGQRIPDFGPEILRWTHCKTTRWSTTLSSKVILPHSVTFRTLCGANLATLPRMSGGKNPWSFTVRYHFTQSVLKVVLRESISTRIRQLILDIRSCKG